MLPKNPAQPRHNPSSYSISLVVFNGEHDLPACLNSVAAQYAKPCECVVYDNNSNDGSMSVIGAHLSRPRLIKGSENIGFGCAHNEIIRSTSSEYILILNQDAVLEEEYCSILVEFMDTNPHAGSVSGKILRVQSLDDIPSTRGIDACGITISLTQHASLTDSGKRAETCENVHEVFGVPATCALYRRSAIEDSSLDSANGKEYFDEDFFMYKEDVDLAYRLRLRGWKSYCVPRAIAYHVRTAKSSCFVLNRGSKLLRYWSYRNHWYVLIKNIPHNLLMRVGLFIAAYEFAKIIYCVFFEQSTLAAFADIRKKYSIMRAKRARISTRTTADAEEIFTWMKDKIF